MRITKTAIAVGAVAAALALAPTAHAGYLGGVDVQGWCSTLPFQGDLTTEAPNGAYSWKCVFTPPGAFAGGPTKRDVDMNAACARQYGGGAWAKPLNANDAWSWRCYN
jgi:hypothetical protein